MSELFLHLCVLAVPRGAGNAGNAATSEKRPNGWTMDRFLASIVEFLLYYMKICKHVGNMLRNSLEIACLIY